MESYTKEIKAIREWSYVEVSDMRPKILKYMGISMHWSKGEVPKIKLGKEKITVCDQNQLRHYSEWLDETISFRDEYEEKYELKRMGERLDS